MKGAVVMELLAVSTYRSGRKYLRFTLASVLEKTLRLVKGNLVILILSWDTQPKKDNLIYINMFRFKTPFFHLEWPTKSNSN